MFLIKWGLRYPTFTTSIGLVNYESRLDDIHQIIKGYSLNQRPVDENDSTLRSKPKPKPNT